MQEVQCSTSNLIISSPGLSTECIKSEEQLRMISQPETKPISPEQLIAEVKGIYDGLVVVDAK